MQTRRLIGLRLACVLLLPLVAYAQEQQVPGAGPAAARELQPGTPAPDFELTDADGKTHKLADYKDKIVVVEWLNQECPKSNFKTGKGPQSKALAEKFAAQGVIWLGVDSTHNRTAAQNQAYAKENGIPYPILMDTDGKVGRAYGAKTTPHVFVIAKGTLVYAGAFDNDPDKVKPKAEYRGYTEDAVQAALKGAPVPLASTKPWGCSVKYK